MGFHVLSERMAALEEVAAGFYVTIGLIPRDTVSVSRLLIISEVWPDSLTERLEQLYFDVGKIPPIP